MSPFFEFISCTLNFQPANYPQGKKMEVKMFLISQLVIIITLGKCFLNSKIALTI